MCLLNCQDIHWAILEPYAEIGWGIRVPLVECMGATEQYAKHGLWLFCCFDDRLRLCFVCVFTVSLIVLLTFQVILCVYVYLLDSVVFLLVFFLF